MQARSSIVYILYSIFCILYSIFNTLFCTESGCILQILGVLRMREKNCLHVELCYLLKAFVQTIVRIQWNTVYEAFHRIVWIPRWAHDKPMRNTCTHVSAWLECVILSQETNETLFDRTHLRLQEMIVKALGVFDPTSSVHKPGVHENGSAEHFKSLNTDHPETADCFKFDYQQLDRRTFAKSDFTKSSTKDFNKGLLLYVSRFDLLLESLSLFLAQVNVAMRKPSPTLGRLLTIFCIYEVFLKKVSCSRRGTRPFVRWLQTAECWHDVSFAATLGVYHHVAGPGPRCGKIMDKSEEIARYITKRPANVNTLLH